MTHPNTDSREQALTKMQMKLAQMYGVSEAKSIIDQLEPHIDAYTANKQLEVLEWVEQELPDRRILPRRWIKDGGSSLTISYGFNQALDEVSQMLKNKKESL